jgi:hypothetical protein
LTEKNLALSRSAWLFEQCFTPSRINHPSPCNFKKTCPISSISLHMRE